MYFDSANKKQNKNFGQAIFSLVFIVGSKGEQKIKEFDILVG